MATQWPLVSARLAALLPTLPGWSAVTVYDGPPVTNDYPRDFVSVGYVDDENAGTYSTVQDPNGFQRIETGTVRCQLSSMSGDTDLSLLRTRVFGLMDAIDDAIRADRTLGVLSPAGTSELDVDVLSLQVSTGAAQSLVFTLHYQTFT